MTSQALRGFRNVKGTATNKHIQSINVVSSLQNYVQFIKSLRLVFSFVTENLVSLQRHTTQGRDTSET